MALITSPRLKFDLSLIAIVVLAIAIRLTDLSIESHFPQPDEGFALDAVMQPTIAATIRFVAADTHPPFYFLVLRIWLTILPSTMFFAKLLSVIFNVANIALTYGLARLWVDRRTARLAALVMMLSPWNIYWSHLARNHQMLPLLFTLSCWSLLNWLRSGRKEFPVWYCLWATLMLQTNYLSFFVLATQGVVAVWECRREIRRSMGVGIAAVIAIAFYAPFAGVLLQQVRQGPMNAGFFQHTVSTGYLFFHFVFFNIFTYRLGALWYPPPSSWGIILIGGGILAVVSIMAVRKLRAPSFYLLLFLPPIMTITAARWMGTTMAERYLAYAIGPFSIFFAVGLAGIFDAIQRQRDISSPRTNTPEEAHFSKNIKQRCDFMIDHSEIVGI